MAFPSSPTDGQEHRKHVYVASQNAWFKLGDTPIGGIITDPGEVIPVSADWPNFCINDFTGSTTVPSTLPYLTMKLRERKVSFNGSTVFTGTVSGTSYTLDVAYEDLATDLMEERLDFGTYTGWRTIDIGGVTYDITNLSGRVLTLSGSPGDGSGVASSFYTHRIAGSTTTARVWV